VTEQAGRPAPMIYHPITTVADLNKHLQWALGVELSTIPPYLCALYSISDPASDAYRLIRSVVMEEMLHMMQAANLMNATGKPPSLAPDLLPVYPGFMPHHAAGGPYIQLQALSPALASTVFMAIELPEVSPHAPPEGNEFATIGQFYKAIELGFETCVERYGEDGVFGHDTGFQRGDTYFGAGGGRLWQVHGLKTAKLALTEITQQGEGAAVPQPPQPGEEPFGGYDHYGDRLDGTYGPILGTPWDMSHYRKFQQIAAGTVALPAIYPMQANPSDVYLLGTVRRLSHLFDACYTLILGSLGQTFSSAGEQGFFQVAFPVMQVALPTIATLLMQTPLLADADPALGPTAGPSFAYRPSPLPDMVAEAAALRDDPPDLGTGYAQLWRGNLGQAQQALSGALAQTASGTPGGAPAWSRSGKRTGAQRR
jgi:hypothetical protein